MSKQITVDTTINAPIDKIWKYWTEPEHITKWCFASDDWCVPNATNDLRIGGKFTTRMEEVGGAKGFDFSGIYTVVEKNKEIEYIIDGDNRKVHISFLKQDNGYKITETFDAEDENSLELQKAGWQAILENFKKHVLEH